VPLFQFYRENELLEQFATRDKARIGNAINRYTLLFEAHGMDGDAYCSQMARAPAIHLKGLYIVTEAVAMYVQACREGYLPFLSLRGCCWAKFWKGVLGQVVWQVVWVSPVISVFLLDVPWCMTTHFRMLQDCTVGITGH